MTAEAHVAANPGHAAYKTPAGWGCVNCDAGDHPFQRLLKERGE